MIHVIIPQYKDLKTAITLYIDKTELCSADIVTLFGKLSKNRIAKLKALALEKMNEKGIPSWSPRRVNTAAAYEAWGLDINDLEERYKKRRELGL